MRPLYILITLFILVGCDDSKPSTSSTKKTTPTKSVGCGTTQTAGTFDGTITVDGTDRVYKIFVPDGYSASTTYSIVFGFHGSAYSNTPDTMISLTGTMRTAAAGKAIFVYPDGHINGVPNYWDKNETGIDVAFFDALLADLEKKYCVDATHVFVVGFSDGGGMANTLGCYRSDVVRGVAEGSGYLPQKNKCGNNAMPFFIWHGRADTITNFTTYAVPEIDHWQQANGCGTSTTAIDPSSEECVSYDSCSDAPLTTCTPNVDHGFPGVIGEPMWKFFESL